jgi:hypothetical protein
MATKRNYELNRETADMIGLRLSTLRQYVSIGVIPALYLGRKRVIQAEVIDRICTEGLKGRGEGRKGGVA